MQLIVSEIEKSFSQKKILNKVSFNVKQGSSLALTGHNGSGKTTLIRILCSLLRPDSGKVIFKNGEQEIKAELLKNHISLVGPYLQLYDELTAFENLKFSARLKNIKKPNEKIYNLINRVGLEGRAHDQAKTYSSGMKQRLKYAFALLSEPDVLFLDEPTSNLDKEGIKIVYNIMNAQREDKVLVFATNDESDLKLADQVVQIDA